jgi:hypothetical protein
MLDGVVRGEVRSKSAREEPFYRVTPVSQSSCGTKQGLSAFHQDTGETGFSVRGRGMYGIATYS